MVKKSTSSSNVPQQAKHSTPKSTKSSPQKNNSISGPHTGSTVLNSKHLHNQSHQQRPRDKESPSVCSGPPNDLMKKLSEAVHKQQKEKESSGGIVSTSNANDATRKRTAPAGKMQNSTTYAGAAFDRAPAAKSFPIPSFIKLAAPNAAALSQSCPLPSSLESPSLKTVSVSELFPRDPSNEKKKLDILTNDLRKLLNLK